MTDSLQRHSDNTETNMSAVIKSKAINALEDIGAMYPSIDLIPIKREYRVVSSLSLYEQYNTLSDLCSAQGNSRPHPEWFQLAGYIKALGIQEVTNSTFSGATASMKNALHPEYAEFVHRNAVALDDMIVRERDYRFSILAMATMAHGYLVTFSNDGVKTVVETPQYMWMRVATFLYYDSKNVSTALAEIKKVYDEMSLGYYIHSSPTLFNSGLLKHQLSSCFTMSVEDSLLGKSSITEMWTNCAIISAGTGAVGIDLSNLRHSEIAGMGNSQGIVPWVKILNEIMKAVNQGSKRKGAACAYLPCWHYDVMEFVDMRLNTGPAEMRAPDIAYALWISDEFMRRVRDNKTWTLFCPNKARDLSTTWGTGFVDKYLDYEDKARRGLLPRHKVINARDLFNRVCANQTKVSMPYMLYKDACNRKNNQSNLGTIRLGNLCLEVMLFVDKHNIGSCNLGSIALNAAVQACTETGRRFYDFELLGRSTASLVRNINRVVDRNLYPKEIPDIKSTNMRNRPLGIGVQGLADTFAMMDVVWDSQEAQDLNHQIAETIYYYAIKESIELAKLYGPYDSFDGSPASKGKFQFDLWDDELYEKYICEHSTGDCSELAAVVKAATDTKRGPATDRYDWDALRSEMMEYGLRNSLLIALMPTATAANILGNSASCEPHTHNVYSKTVLSGQFTVLNPHMVRDLESIGMWTTPVIRQIWKDRGSLTSIPIPKDMNAKTMDRLEFLKKKYMSAYEIPQRRILKMMLDRGRYVCQSQSFNYFCKNPTPAALTAFHFATWKGGAKTGMYYLRMNAVSDPHNISLDYIRSPKDSTVMTTVDIVHQSVVAKSTYVCTDDICTSCT